MARAAYAPFVVPLPRWAGLPPVVLLAAALVSGPDLGSFTIVGTVVTTVLLSAIFYALVATARPGRLPDGARVVADATVRRWLLVAGAAAEAACVALLAVSDVTAPAGVGLATGIFAVAASGWWSDRLTLRIERRDGVRFQYRLDRRLLWWPHAVRAPSQSRVDGRP
jgi:hypothetical protein